ncbi:hypothetical protein EI546_03670 [Aequorivita sp. H23M31]|uniref:Uncharacterized protein n=1 Tax=Aequorivita ciconiae TaxID=2494375 RepID=A0A410G0S9_9FLAO|nr:hypothetical protein [Aequorivita sp. H23M31]QAA80882.1 hypothetical protein EI546_03670 [Aequorivita sp. H23M31]
MKYSVKFPYDVLKHSLRINGNPSEDFYEYEISLPPAVHSVFINGTSGIGFTDINLVAEVNCSATMYRKCFISEDIEDKSLNFKIPKKAVGVNFEIDTMIVAKRPIPLDGQRIEKGMPLAHLGSHKYKIDKSRIGLIEFEVSKAKDISYLFNSHTIKIQLPEEVYKELVKMKNRPEIKHFLASQLAQVALLEACQLLVENGGSNHLAWYEELHKRWVLLSGGDKDYPDPEDHLSLVNHILQEPSLTFAHYLINTAKIEKDE